MKKICMLISPQGVLKVWPVGVTGSECTEFTKKFNESLGLIEPERQLKPEYWQENQQQQQQGT